MSLPDAEQSIAAAKRIRLDPDRVEDAKRRARAAALVAQHHERMAAAERARVAILARTWGFDASEVEAGP